MYFLVFLFFSVLNKLLQKVAVTHFDVEAYQLWQYICGTIAAFIFFLVAQKRKLVERKELFYKGSVIIGSLIGIIGFGGGYLYLRALDVGPFPLVNAIHALYIFVSAIFAYFLFKEKLTTRKVILLFLAIAAIVLMRIG